MKIMEHLLIWDVHKGLEVIFKVTPGTGQILRSCWNNRCSIKPDTFRVRCSCTDIKLLKRVTLNEKMFNYHFAVNRKRQNTILVSDYRIWSYPHDIINDKINCYGRGGTFSTRGKSLKKISRYCQNDKVAAWTLTWATGRRFVIPQVLLK